MRRGDFLKRIAAMACLLFCIGCTPDVFGIATGVKPGQTVDLVTASPSQVVLEYTHSYSWELAAAGRFADGQCQRFGRHAALVSTAQESVDRSMATFTCERAVGPTEPQRTTVTFADWTLRCVPPAVGWVPCEVTQIIYDKKRPVARTAIGRPSKTEALRLTILVPAGVQIGTRPRFMAGDGDAAIDLTWRRCLPAGCLADLVLSDEELKKLRAQTNNGRIVFQDRAGRAAVIPFAPNGLAPALDALAREAG